MFTNNSYLICRWQPTRAPSPWEGILQATTPGPVCPQKLPGSKILFADYTDRRKGPKPILCSLWSQNKRAQALIDGYWALYCPLLTQPLHVHLFSAQPIQRLQLLYLNGVIGVQ